MTLIILITTAIYLLLFVWTWHSLGFIEKTKKVAIILIETFVMYILTLVIFQIAKGGITYEKIEIQKNVQNVLVSIFSAINGMIVMPQIGKIFDKINEDEIKKEEMKKRLIIVSTIFVVCLIFEAGYMKDTQKGILKMYEASKQQN